MNANNNSSTISAKSKCFYNANHYFSDAVFNNNVCAVKDFLQQSNTINPTIYDNFALLRYAFVRGHKAIIYCLTASTKASWGP